MPPTMSQNKPTARKPRQSEYGKRLSAKQAAKAEYGVREKQFRRYFEAARKVRAATGQKLLELLERRLDNVVYRLDLSQTRRQARQWISHGHIRVNGKKMSIPSYQVALHDEVELVVPTLVARRDVEIPAWLRGNLEKFSGTVEAFPERGEISPDIEEQLIVEFYSR